MANELQTTTGVRRDGQYHEFQPGEYGKAPFAEPSGFRWMCRPPWKHSGGDLINHKVTEHEDGTITVSPSILIQTGPNMAWKWHGYLERGVWRECEPTKQGGGE